MRDSRQGVNKVSSFYLAILEKVREGMDDVLANECSPFVSRPPPPKTVSLRRRVSLHESGHAVTAWSTASVAFVYCISLKIEWGVANTLVAFNTGTARHRLLWGMLVTILGGIAAEDRFCGGFEPLDALDDLIAARIFAEMLANIEIEQEVVLATPSKESRTSQHEDVSALFEHQLTGRSRDILNAAYRRARRVVRQRNRQLQELARRVAKKDTLMSAEISDILGPRPNFGDGPVHFKK